MVFGSGGLPQRYLNPDFFIQETKRLGLTPDISEQFKSIVQDLVGQFQKDVEATSEGFTTFLQQSSDLGQKELMKAFSKTQDHIDGLTGNFLNQMRSLLTEKVGSDHQSAIEQFVEDVHAEIAPFTNLEQRVRSNVTLNQKMPPRSIFELSPSVKAEARRGAPPAGPFQGYIDKLTNWEKKYPPDSAQYKFAQDIINILKGLNSKTPPPTLQDAIRLIHQEIYTDNNPAYGKRDIYMRYPGLSEGSGLNPNQVNDISQILSDGTTKLDVPPFTQMDKKYIEARTYFNPQDGDLAQLLQEEIAKLGSNDNEIGNLKQWAENLISSGNYHFTQASAIGQGQFVQIVGIVIPISPTTGLELEEEQIAKYLEMKMAEFKQFLIDLGLPPGFVPSSNWEAFWDKEARRAHGEASKLAADIARTKQTGGWLALQRKWNLPPGNAQTIEKEANARLYAYQHVMNGCEEQSAISLFTKVLAEIKKLEASKGTLSDLAKWASGIDLSKYPGLSEQDILIIRRLAQG